MVLPLSSFDGSNYKIYVPTTSIKTKYKVNIADQYGLLYINGVLVNDAKMQTGILTGDTTVINAFAVVWSVIESPVDRVTTAVILDLPFLTPFIFPALLTVAIFFLADLYDTDLTDTIPACKAFQVLKKEK